MSQTNEASDMAVEPGQKVMKVTRNSGEPVQAIKDSSDPVKKSASSNETSNSTEARDTSKSESTSKFSSGSLESSDVSNSDTIKENVTPKSASNSDGERTSNTGKSDIMETSKPATKSFEPTSNSVRSDLMETSEPATKSFEPTSQPSSNSDVDPPSKLISKPSSISSTSNSLKYAIVRNIPKIFRSGDLRRFFSEFVETSTFSMFHFRHRPEIQKTSKDNEETTKKSSATRCCVVRLSNEKDQKGFIRRYNGLHWTDSSHKELLSKCFISPVKLRPEDELKLSELRPPAVMPRGNVGTTTRHFLDLIRECRLPPQTIAKLGLEFPRQRRKRIYGSVPMDYGTTTATRGRSGEEENEGEAEFKKPKGRDVKDPESGSDDDDDTCEEWERHTALHDDVAARRIDPEDISAQAGTKDRLYEEEMEVTWDKGSSGLVFYTDAQFWKEHEGLNDFDRSTVDDWDVDYSVYYDKDKRYGEGINGDKDARDALEAREERMKRNGEIVESAFAKKSKPEQRRPNKTRRNSFEADPNERIGKFEAHTKGIGRKIMETQGWVDGKGLGKKEGMKVALDAEDGQTNRSGFGYHGEAVLAKRSRDEIARQRPNYNDGGKSRERTSIRDVIISTIFDDPEKTDPGETLKRRNPGNYLKSRKE